MVLGMVVEEQKFRAFTENAMVILVGWWMHYPYIYIYIRLSDHSPKKKKG